MSTLPKTVSGEAEARLLVSQAKRYGLDPAAVLAVTTVEEPGLRNQPGDNGTSFGPFQLHAGGELPADVMAHGAAYANAWANSEQGIDYGLRREASVAHGLSGAAAIHAIVYFFERPANKQAEESTALQRYAASQKEAGKIDTRNPSIGGDFLHGIEGGIGILNKGARHIPGVAQAEGGASAVGSAVGDAAGGVADVAKGTAHVLGKLTDPVTWERVLYVIVGAALMGGGLLIVAKELGFRNTVPLGAAGKAAKFLAP